MRHGPLNNVEGMNGVNRVNGWGLAVVVALGSLSGCASLDYDRSPQAPTLSIRPTDENVEHPTPPALPHVATAQNAEDGAPESAHEPLRLTVEGAIAHALTHNQSLRVAELNPALAQTVTGEQRALFDPTLAGTATWTRTEADRDIEADIPIEVDTGTGLGSVTVGRLTRDIRTETTTRGASAAVGLTQLLPTGTEIEVTVTPSSTSQSLEASARDFDTGSDTENDGASVELSITQRLLRGAGLGVNLASLKQARLAVEASDYEFRGFVETLVAQVESTYWDYLLAQRQITIFEDSLALAESQAAEVEERIRVGRVAESERAAMAAEVAQRRSSLIDARSHLAQVRLTLMRLLNPGDDALKSRELALVSEPVMPDIRLDEVEDSVKLAMAMRPELNQARLQIKRDTLELVKTRNGLLPQLDVFLALSESRTTTDYADVLRASVRGTRNDTLRTDFGAVFSYPLGNRAARARHQRAHFAHDQDKEALLNLSQLVEQDVRGAYIELDRAREQVKATEATRKLQETAAQTELEKFRVGKSTALLVAQAQRDLLVAQINEVQAVATFLKAIVNLYRLDGSLLLRRGIECPGATPVDLS